MDCPATIHGCPLYKSDKYLRFTGLCDHKGPTCVKKGTYFCIKCKFDVCEECFKFEQLPDEVRNGKRLKLEREQTQKQTEHKRIDENIMAKLETFPRVHGGLTIKELLAEYTARQYTYSKKDKLTKNDLLENLIDDTILLSQTDAYKEVERIREAINGEAAIKKINAEKLVKDRRQKVESQKAKAKTKKQAKKKQAEEEYQKIQEERRQERLKVLTSLHTVYCPPSIHGCLLAKSDDLERWNGLCDTKGLDCTKNGAYACTICNFDVCQACLDFELLPQNIQTEKRLAFEKKKLEKQIKQKMLEERKQERLDAQEKQKQKERKLLCTRLENTPSNIQNPKGKHTNQNKLLAYVVWKSTGYDNDGWHNYEGPPSKEFDSSFSKEKDANARVEYLFFVDNPWGVSWEELLENNEEDIDIEPVTSGLLSLEVCPPDSERWTVSAVEKEDFQDFEEELSSDEEQTCYSF